MEHFFKGIQVYFEETASKFLKQRSLLAEKVCSMKSLLLPLNTELKTHENTPFFKRTVCLSVQNMPYLFTMQGFLSRRSSTGLAKNELSCQSKVLFPLVHACFQDMQQRSNHHPFILVYCATGQNWIPFSSNIHWLNTIFHSKNFCIALSFYPTDFFSAVLMGLLSGPCSLLLPDVQTTASSCVTIASKIS